MKNTQKGFIVPILIALVAILAVGSGVYVYTKSQPTKPLMELPTNNQPSIISISPESATLDAVVSGSGINATITGTGFTSTENTVLFGNHASGRGNFVINNISSVDGKTIQFQVPMDALLGASSVVVKNSNGTSNEVNFILTQNNSNQTSKNWQTYTNTQYGFSLKFPNSWKEYTVNTTQTVNQNNGDKFININFAIAGNNIFTIIPFTKSQWSIYGAGEVVPAFINQNDSYVFTYSTKQDYKPEVTQQELLAIPSIISTFKFINPTTQSNVSVDKVTDSFTATPFSGTAPLKVTFETSGKYNAFASFNFGDGTTISPATLPPVNDFACNAAAQYSVCQGTHTYSKAGTYIASMYDNQGKILNTTKITVQN